MPENPVPDQSTRVNVSNLSVQDAASLFNVISSSSLSSGTESLTESQHTKESVAADKNSNFDENFRSHHLNLPPVQLHLRKMEDIAQISAIEQADKWSDLDVYEPLGALLTNYSHRIHGVCALISKISSSNVLPFRGLKTKYEGTRTESPIRFPQPPCHYANGLPV